MLHVWLVMLYFTIYSKRYMTVVKNIESVSLFIGAVGGVLFSFVVFMYFFPTRLPVGKETALTPSVKMDSSMHMAVNPYEMERITTEQQFLKEMKLHHEAAVTMAQQVLALKNIHGEVKNLANAIISAQTSEIKMMSGWITNWKY